jgi:hypothetical protein
MHASAQKLRDEIDREGVFWSPPEWKTQQKPAKPGVPPSQSNAITIAGDLKITKPPPKPRMVK